MSEKEKEKLFTKITEKHYSPLIIRKYTKNFPLFVAIISDDDLDDLDNVVIKHLEEKVKTIQEARDFCGELTEKLKEKYSKSEGVAVVGYFDKLMVSSLYGDFMNHTPARIELYSLLNMMTNI